MTYRERYKQLHPEEDVTDIHLDACPDQVLDVPTFPCPFHDDDFFIAAATAGMPKFLARRRVAYDLP